jgi:polysaccharide export outer membrane protein
MTLFCGADFSRQRRDSSPPAQVRSYPRVLPEISLRINNLRGLAAAVRWTLALLTLVFTLSAQSPTVLSRPPVSVEPASTNLPAQRIGPDDLIGLSVYDSPEFTRTIRVGPDGAIRLPMLKQRVKADGLMPGELESAVAGALVEEQLLVDPFVTVTVVEYHSRPISVVGAVKKPITFQAIGLVTLIDALTRAEGLSDEASGEILVSRSDAAGNRTLAQRILYRQLIDAADPVLNIRLTGGEEIRVPTVSKVFVIGNVKKPGAFSITDTGAMTVLKAVALCEGLAPYSAKVAYIQRTDDKSSAKAEVLVELKKIMDRKAPDVELQPKDILYIPDNTGRRLTASVLERLAGFGSSTASGVLIWH